MGEYKGAVVKIQMIPMRGNYASTAAEEAVRDQARVLKIIAANPMVR